MTYQIVPESAPFNIEQRAWLNGFLAGVLGVLDQQSAPGGSATVLAAAASQLTPPVGAGLPSGQAAEESFPWHDPSLSLADRMNLARGQPKERRLMAAMAQLNCGSCGYLCKTYSEAIASGTEKNLTLCSPGGNDTAKALRTLVKEPETQAAKELPSVLGSVEPTVVALGTRDNPVQAKLISSERLNGPDSAKDTRHVVIDLEGSALSYRVGDALGLWPTNCNELVSRVLEAAKIDPKAKVSINDAENKPESVPILELLAGKCLRTMTSELLEASIECVRNRPKQNGAVAQDADLLGKLEAFVDLDAFYDWDVLEFLEAFPSLHLTCTI